MWWSPRWILFSVNSSNALCIDTDPTDAGRLGQVVLFWDDWGHRPIEAPSFRDWLAEFVYELEKPMDSRYRGGMSWDGPKRRTWCGTAQ